MIQKIKGIMAIDASLDEISKKIKTVSREVKSVGDDFVETKQIILELKAGLKEQSKAIAIINEDVISLKSIKQDFEKEIYDFKLLKNSMQKEIIERFEKDIENKMGNLFEQINDNLSEHVNLRKNYQILTEKINELTPEIDKFKRISQCLKEKDFTLERYAKKLDQYEGDKIRLLKKIDSLERMVSKFRRSRG